MESSIILSIFILIIFILFLTIGYLLLTDFHIELDNEKTEENIS
jgi:hypothetical protein